MMRVTDEQLAVLRAFLEADTDAERLALSIATPEQADAFGGLVYAAFARAVRRRFSSSWTVADVIHFVASTRVKFLEANAEISPKAAESLIRQALGEPVTASPDATVFLVILGAVVLDDELEGDELTTFLAQARQDADSVFARADSG